MQVSKWALAGSLLWLAAALVVPDSASKRYEDALHGATCLRASYVMSGPMTPEASCTLVYEKPDRFRIETPTRLTVCDGKTVWDYWKEAKVYTKARFSLDRTREEDVWGWAAFFGSGLLSPGKVSGTDSAGGFETIRYEMPFGRGGWIRGEAGKGRVLAFGVSSEPALWQTSSTSVTYGGAAPDSSAFKFVAPAGSREIPATVSYREIGQLFDDYCFPCHDFATHESGLNLSSYEGLMKGGDHGPVIEPGKPANSLLYIDISSIHLPFMPPHEGVGEAWRRYRLGLWISQGAKKDAR